MALDDGQILEQYKERKKESRECNAPFFKEAARAWGFYSGSGQWEQEDRDRLRAEQRPCLTLNNIRPIVDVVAGTEVTNRFMPKFRPRKAGTEQFADLISEQVRYIRDQTNAEQEESRAFKEAVITGAGCCELRQDHTDNREGIQKIECVSIFGMLWDPMARQTNMLDGRYVIREKRIHKNDFKALFPDDADLTDRSSQGDSSSTSSMGTIEVTSHRDTYTTGTSEPSNLFRKNTMLVSDYQWWDLEDYWTSIDPFTEQYIDFDTKRESEDWLMNVILQIRSISPEMLQPGQQVPQIPVIVNLKRRKYQRAFLCGGRLLESGPSPLEKHFTHQFITCFEEAGEDRTKFFGLIRGAMDPQSAYNKYVSQMIHIVSVNPKGVLGWETGAFANPQKAMQQWSNPQGQIEFAPGGLQRVQQFKAAQVPDGLRELSDIAKGALPETTGVNVNYMGGQAEDLRRTAGSAVQAIQRQGMVVLSSPFDALRLFRREGARTLQEYIRLYWTEGRSFRLTGNQFAQYTKDAAMHEYDVVVDEAPSTPNQKTENWQALTQNGQLELLQKMGVIDGEIVADMVPGISADIVERMKAKFQQAQMMAQQQAQQTQGQPPGGQSSPAGEAAQG